MADTSIAVSDEVWRELHRRKQRGDTFDDVLRRLLDMDGEDEKAVDTGTVEKRELETNETRPVPEDMPQRIDEDEALAAIDAAVELIHDRDGASMREIVEKVMADHPLGYEVPELQKGDRYRGAWYRSVIKPGLENHPDVEKPPQSGSKWRSK